MTDLRTQMHRMADAVEPLPVDDDLWQRGVAARRRGQALVVAAVLAIIASVTWSAVLLGTGGREARTASSPVESGAIPSRIEDIPADLAVTTGLAVGRASAAFISSTGDPVVITAIDGVPHRLGLQGWDPARRMLALSPDGRWLAYQRADAGATVLTRLDLETGRERVLRREADETLTYDSLAWSPGGAWLAWSSSRYDGVPAAGRVRPRLSKVYVLPFTPTGVAVADSGAMAIASARGALFLPVDGQRGLGRVAADGAFGVGAFSPSGSDLALNTAPDTSSYTLDVQTGAVLGHPFPEGTLSASVVRPLGWLDDRLQVLLVQSADESSRELVVATPEVGATSTWRRSVGSVETTGIANSLSLAVDLIPDLDGTSSQALTYDFPPPAGRDISWIIGLGVAAAVAVLMALRWLWRRFVSVAE